MSGMPIVRVPQILVTNATSSLRPPQVKGGSASLASKPRLPKCTGSGKAQTARVPAQYDASARHGRLGHPGYMTVHDTPREVLWAGLASITRESMISTLASSYAIGEAERDAAMRNHLQEYDSDSDDASSPSSPVRCKPSPWPLWGSQKSQLMLRRKRSSHAPISRHVSCVPDLEVHSGDAPFLAWQAVFQDWVRALTDELLALRSANVVVTVEVFLRRVREATVVPPQGDPASAPLSMSQLTVKANTRYPHILALAAAVYAMEAHLLPAMGQFERSAREALRELMRCIYVDPPSAADKAKDSAAGCYVRETYLQRCSDLRLLYLALRDRFRQRQAVRERQEHILFKSVARWQGQVTHRSFTAWHVYTRRCRKLRERYRRYITSLSDTAVRERAVKSWAQLAHRVVSQARQEQQQQQPHEYSFLGETQAKEIAVLAELAAAARQKQVKAAMVEQGTGVNRALTERKKKQDATLSAVKKRHQSVAATFSRIMQVILPAPQKPSSRSRKESLFAENAQYFAGIEEMRVRVLSWAADLAAADEFVSGKSLYQFILGTAAAAKQSAFGAGVLSRGMHLLPLLRTALVLLVKPLEAAPLPFERSSLRRPSLSLQRHAPEMLPESCRQKAVTLVEQHHAAMAEHEQQQDQEQQQQQRQQQSPILKSSTSCHAFTNPTDEDGENRSLPRLTSLGSFRKKSVGKSDEPFESVAVTQHKKELAALLAPIADAGTVTAMAGFILELIGRLSCPIGSPGTQTAAVSGWGIPQLVPVACARHIATAGEVWRDYVLTLLFYSQFALSCGVFRVMPRVSPVEIQQPKAAAAVPLVLPRSKSIKDPDKAYDDTTAFSIKTAWLERQKQRRICGDDERARQSHYALDLATKSIVSNAGSCGSIILEATRLYEHFLAAQPIIATTKIISTEYMTSKMRIVFGRDSSFWRPVTSNRPVRSPKDMEELLYTLATAGGTAPLAVCEKLMASLDDVDWFYISLASQEVQDVMEQHIHDLSLIFALHAVGAPPSNFLNLDGWRELNSQWLDSQYSAVQVDEIYDAIMLRNKDAMSARQQSLLSGTFACEFPSIPFESEGSGIIAPQDGAPQGFDIDCFAQALCVVTSYKIPDPFSPLEAKVQLFITQWLIPMVGSKVKKNSRRSSVQRPSS